MQKEINFDDGSSEYHVKEYKSSTLDALWDKWIIFKPKRRDRKSVV